MTESRSRAARALLPATLAVLLVSAPAARAAGGATADTVSTGSGTATTTGTGTATDNGTGTAGDGPVVFRHALDNSPLAFELRPDQKITPEVLHFRATGENPYAGEPQAIEAGQQIYRRHCQSCHLPDGTGRIGPNLTDDAWIRARTDTPVGRFEIIYGGGAGAMQAFGRSLDQDQILKVMGYIDTFRKDAGGSDPSAD
jgi:cytochrome c-L